MREQDDEHNPTLFLQNWADKIYAVIDISHDAPVYDTKSLEKGGVEYHKFPTVSKIPPTPLEVQDFCILVDKLVAERDAKSRSEDGNNQLNTKSTNKRAIAVHCHYGYNRTGFFICSYLISRKAFGVQDAIDEFRKAKSPGIRHEHFIDVLWLRYSNVASRQAAARNKQDGLKGEADRDESLNNAERRTRSTISSMTGSKDSKRQHSGEGTRRRKVGTNSLGLPLFDFDAGAVSEGDLM